MEFYPGRYTALTGIRVRSTRNTQTDRNIVGALSADEGFDVLQVYAEDEGKTGIVWGRISQNIGNSPTNQRFVALSVNTNPKARMEQVYSAPVGGDASLAVQVAKLEEIVKTLTALVDDLKK